MYSLTGTSLVKACECATTSCCIRSHGQPLRLCGTCGPVENLRTQCMRAPSGTYMMVADHIANRADAHWHLCPTNTRLHFRAVHRYKKSRTGTYRMYMLPVSFDSTRSTRTCGTRREQTDQVRQRGQCLRDLRDTKHNAMISERSKQACSNLGSLSRGFFGCGRSADTTGSRVFLTS
jgi:hypothetical protein